MYEHVGNHKQKYKSKKTIRTNTIISKSINIKKTIHSHETHANLHKSTTNNEND